MTPTVEELRKSYDWQEVMKYASIVREDRCGQSGKAPVRRVLVPEVDCASPAAGAAYQAISESTFGFDDVARVIAVAEGENDGPNWVGAFELKDGRFGVVRAGCDYTGWG